MLPNHLFLALVFLCATRASPSLQVSALDCGAECQTYNNQQTRNSNSSLDVLKSSENKTISKNQTKISKRQLDTFGFGFGFRPELRPRFSAGGFRSRFDNNGIFGTPFGGNVISPRFSRLGNRDGFMVPLPTTAAVSDQIVDVSRSSTGLNPNGLFPPSMNEFRDVFRSGAFKAGLLGFGGSPFGRSPFLRRPGSSSVTQNNIIIVQPSSTKNINNNNAVGSLGGSSNFNNNNIVTGRLGVPVPEPMGSVEFSDQTTNINNNNAGGSVAGGSNFNNNNVQGSDSRLVGDSATNINNNNAGGSSNNFNNNNVINMIQNKLGGLLVDLAGSKTNINNNNAGSGSIGGMSSNFNNNNVLGNKAGSGQVNVNNNNAGHESLGEGEG